MAHVVSLAQSTKADAARLKIEWGSNVLRATTSGERNSLQDLCWICAYLLNLFPSADGTTRAPRLARTESIEQTDDAVLK